MSKSSMTHMGIRLQQARKVAGLSRRALAELTKLSHATIKKYEDGKVTPSSDILIRLARVLNIRVDFFFRPIRVLLQDLHFRKRKSSTSNQMFP